jgi:hypothetical protein
MGLLEPLAALDFQYLQLQERHPAEVQFDAVDSFNLRPGKVDDFCVLLHALLSPCLQNWLRLYCWSRSWRSWLNVWCRDRLRCWLGLWFRLPLLLVDALMLGFIEALILSTVLPCRVGGVAGGQDYDYCCCDYE